jgi:glycosyltransferase involved in cell wall biosynthesis
MDRHRIAIVIPALNEAATIARVVAGAAPWGTPIVVDDGSSDGTGSVAMGAGAIVVTHPGRRGYDEALNSGFARASERGFEYVITIDADGQHDPGTIGAFISGLASGADVVIGVRDRLQRFAEYVFAWVGARKWAIRDPLCGMKAYRTAVYDELGHFDSYSSIGTELALFAARRHKILLQLPVKTRDRLDQARFGNRLSANRRIFRALLIGMRRHG